VYAQPGGGDLESAWPRVRRYANVIRDFVRGGGRYLGFCLGGYLAGATPGFGLLPGDAERYVGTDAAGVHTLADTVVTVHWRGRSRRMYFQDGPAFQLQAGASATVLAVYDNGLPAAVVAGFGSGSVGVVGPHPEADGAWFAESGLPDVGGPAFDLGYDLVETTVHGALP
jgi:glutamine amidotransferase-like uncharacterized protein